jgi:NADH:ubiquinone oxidoreductase subunit F (NADH-binding)
MLDRPLDVARVKDLAEAVQLASLCGLGQAAPLSLLSGLAAFPEEFGIMGPS